MTTKIDIELDDEDYKTVKHFKKVFDAIMEEETKMKDYLKAIIVIGLNSMLKDVTSQEKEILWQTILAINKEKPDFFSDFVVN